MQRDAMRCHVRGRTTIFTASPELMDEVLKVCSDFPMLGHARIAADLGITVRTLRIWLAHARAGRAKQRRADNRILNRWGWTLE